MARFYVTVTMHHTVERPDAWTADEEAKLIRSQTVIGQYGPDEVTITYFEPAESEGGEG